MKIALVMPDLDAAGAQRVMLDLAAGMSERGLTVDLVVVRATGGFRDAIPAGVRLVDLEASRAVTALPALVRYFRRERPDGVVACLNHVNLLTIAAARLSRLRGPVVVTQHNQLSSSAPRKPTRRARAMPKLLAVGLRFADRIVAVSDGVAADLASELGLERRLVEVIYNPVDVARMAQAAAATAEVDWPPGPGPRLLAVGRLTEQKDFPTLLRAVAEVPEARLLVLGDGELRAALEAMADDLGVATRVRFAGLVENPFPLFRAADVFVLSSAWEGLPTVVIEALALSPRIVATDCPSGPREILGDGRWGRLVPVGDADALARGVREELATPLRDRDGALARYDRAAVTDQYVALVTT